MILDNSLNSNRYNYKQTKIKRNNERKKKEYANKKTNKEMCLKKENIKWYVKEYKE